jgi:hypothetical protein
MKRATILTASLSALAIACATASPKFGFRLRTERPPEMDAITVADLEYENEKFSLVLPHNWRIEPDFGAQSLRLHSELTRAVLTVQFHQSAPGDVSKSVDALRQFLAPTLNSSNVIEEFAVYSGVGEGKGMLCHYGDDWRLRAAVVPLNRGCVSFGLAFRTNETSGQQAFGALITSFRRKTN